MIRRFSEEERLRAIYRSAVNDWKKPMRDHAFDNSVLAEHTPYTASDLNSIVVALKDCPDVSVEDVVHLIKERQTYLEQEPDNGEA